MTTITINEDIPLKQLAFSSLAELLASLEQNGLVVSLHEVLGDEVTDDMRRKAKDAAKQYRDDPSSFSRL